MYNEMLSNQNSWASKVLADPAYCPQDDAQEDATKRNLLFRYMAQLKTIKLQMNMLSEAKRDTERELHRLKWGSQKKISECGREEAVCSSSSST